MATVRIIVKKKDGKPRLDESGETLIYVQYGHQEKTILFNSRVKVRPDNLCFQNKFKLTLDQINPLNRKSTGYSTKNTNIRKLYHEVDRVKDSLINRGIEPTVDKVKDEFSNIRSNVKDEAEDFFGLFDEFIDVKKKKAADSSIKQYRSCYNNLKEYGSKKRISITLDKINIEFYDKYVKYLSTEKKMPNESKGMSNNTVGNQIKNLKTFLNHLKKRGHKIDADLTDFIVWKQNTAVIYLYQDELEALYNLDLSNNESLERVRDLFILGCSTGLRYSDLSRLGKEHINGGIIKMKAHKNKKDVTIPITPKAEFILKKYNYVLPKISEQKFNEYIKKAAKKAEIDLLTEKIVYRGGKTLYTKVPKYELVSSHTAVKTFITHCGEKGISAKVVAEITGKTVKIILDHYYGTNDRVIQMEMERAFGAINQINVI